MKTNSDKCRGIVLQCLKDGCKTRNEVVHRSGICDSTVSKWMKDLVAAGEAYIERYAFIKVGGRMAAIYKVGRAPENHVATKDRIKNKPKCERTYTKKVQVPGQSEWAARVLAGREDFLIRQTKITPKRDLLTSALFGDA